MADVTPALPAEIGTLGDLARRAEQGDRAALAELRAWLDRNPDVWRQVGDLALHAEMALVRLVAAGDPLVGGSIQRRMDELRAELLGTSPTAVERLLVDRVVISWAQAHVADLDASARGQGGPASALALRRQDAAHRRYLSALGELTKVRVLLRRAGPLPAVLRTVG